MLQPLASTARVLAGRAPGCGAWFLEPISLQDFFKICDLVCFARFGGGRFTLIFARFGGQFYTHFS